ncbi:MAG: peptidylprolyl isomerase [Lachnospiraceae bacterium]|nr:peptidylprolyl isomerase [Lachnospiraceae bacterium]
MKYSIGNRSLGRRIFCLLAVFVVLLTACGKGGGGTTVVLTTGFRKDEVFRIDSVSCTLPEIMVYLTNTQNQYESVYGKQIWDTDMDGVTLEENVKDTVLARIAQIKSMALMAKEKGVTLTEEEKALAGQAASRYYGGLNETEVALMGVEEKTINTLYQEFALAQKVYQLIIQDINPEISDDEARTIKVQHILIKTYTLDGTGKKVEYTDTAKQEAYEKAVSVQQKALKEGQDFESLATQYSEDSVMTYSFRKGEMDADFEAAAFQLGNNEISDVVTSSYGYHIIKCLSTFDREETDNNKLKIVEERRQEVFGQEYDLFVEGLTRNLNEDLWETVSFIHDPAVETSDFFDVYNEYFPQ